MAPHRRLRLSLWGIQCVPSSSLHRSRMQRVRQLLRLQQGVSWDCLSLSSDVCNLQYRITRNWRLRLSLCRGMMRAHARAHHGPTIASSEGESGIEESSEAVIDESTSFVIGSLFG